jgi:hypothetical protein
MAAPAVGGWVLNKKTYQNDVVIQKGRKVEIRSMEFHETETDLMKHTGGLKKKGLVQNVSITRPVRLAGG